MSRKHPVASTATLSATLIVLACAYTASAGAATITPFRSVTFNTPAPGTPMPRMLAQQSQQQLQNAAHNAQVRNSQLQMAQRIQEQQAAQRNQQQMRDSQAQATRNRLHNAQPAPPTNASSQMQADREAMQQRTALNNAEAESARQQQELRRTGQQVDAASLQEQRARIQLQNAQPVAPRQPPVQSTTPRP